MDLISMLYQRIAYNEELYSKFYIFIQELSKYQKNSAVKEIFERCENNFFDISINESSSDNYYDVGKIIISFDDDSKYCNLKYMIYLSFLPYQNIYLPKILIEKNQFLVGFVVN